MAMMTSDNSGMLSNYYTSSTKIDRGHAQFSVKSGVIYNIRKSEESFAIGPDWYTVKRDVHGEVIDVTETGGGDGAVNLPKVINAPKGDASAQPEMVHHPKHYNSHPSGVEAITVIEHMPFNIGNAIKYMWRADHKGAAIEDLKKAAWYINREIERLENVHGI